MLPPLRDDQRRALLRLSILMCSAALALLPLTAQSSFDASAAEAIVQPALDVPTVPDRLRFPDVSVSRDPFVPDAASIAAPLVMNNAEVGTQVQGGDDIGIVLPPNAGASGVPGGPVGTGGQPLVRAVVVGPSSRALIDMGGAVRVLGVGDPLGPARIRTIDAGGVTLDNGAHLPLTQEHNQ